MKNLLSKKFIAFIITMAVLAGVIIVTVLTQQITFNVTIFLVILAIGLAGVPIGYVVSQTSLDKFIEGVGNIAGKMKKDKD